MLQPRFPVKVPNLDEVEAPEVFVPDMMMVEFPEGGGGKTSFGCFGNLGGGGRGGDSGLVGRGIKLYFSLSWTICQTV